MAPKEETSQERNSTDGVIEENKMVDVSFKPENIAGTGKHTTKLYSPTNNVACGSETRDLAVAEKFTKELNDAKSLLGEEVCEKQDTLIVNIHKTAGSGTGICSTLNESNSCLEERDGSLTMSLCVSVAEGTDLPPELWYAAMRKEPVNVWILQVADSELTSDNKMTLPLQVVLPLDQTWSWGNSSDPASSDEDEPPTYTTLQTVSWDDTSCHSGQPWDNSLEGAGSSGFSDDEEMSSMTGDNFYMLSSDSGIQTSSSDGDLRMLHLAGAVPVEDTWSEDANTFALAELRLSSDADSRCSIDTDRQNEQLLPLPAGNSKESFSCPLCHKTFTDQLNFKYHKRSHKDRKLFTCDCCNQKFAREKTLERHRLTHSVPVRPLLIECSICGEGFEQRTQLKTHLRTVHRDESAELDGGKARGIAPFTCEICRKTFAHETRLKHHQAAHYERQYKCHICTVTLATKHSLRRHLYIHSGQKPFCCETCGKAFAFELYLRNHMKKHLSFKLHDCAFCPERFCSRRELKAHLQSHRGQYQCQLCDEIFRSKHKWQEHMRSHES